MSGNDFIVPPMTWEEIGRFADAIRELAGYKDKPMLPVVDLLELVMPKLMPHYHLEVVEDHEMTGMMGVTCPKGTFVRLPESTYTRACAGVGRDRFTVAHELGHLVLHTDCELVLMTRGADVPAYQRAEPQANQFAAALLMPRHLIRAGEHSGHLEMKFGVSGEAAQNRLRYLSGRGLLPKTGSVM